jgi:hypothetical protein
MVEAGGVELCTPIENTEVIENTRRTMLEKSRNCGSVVHDMYANKDPEQPLLADLLKDSHPKTPLPFGI